MGNRVRLRGAGPQLEGKFWESDRLLRIGRMETSEIVLSDPSISRRHAEVVLGDQGWVVRDLGSTNGSFLNGVRVGQTYRKIRQRDVLQCGNLVMVVAILEEDQQAPTDTPAGNMQVQASAQHSWDEALEVAASHRLKLPRPGDPLLTLLRASHHLTHIGNIDELLRSVLDDTVTTLDAQRGSIVLADDAGNLQLRAVSTGMRETGGRSCFSRSMAQRCFSRGESLLCRDVNTEPELLAARSIADGTMASILCVLLRSPRKRIGILHLDRGPLQEAFTLDDLHLADAIAASVSAGIESAQLLEKQREMFIQTVTALAQTMELRDQYTGGHTQRVTDYSMLLAEELRLSATDRQTIQIGCPLHDVGKIGIDDRILRKQDRLTAEEFEIMKSHTLKGAAILETIPDLAPVIPVVRNHHERWDGTGYPDGLAGENIPRLARIVAVADAFDAMTSDRPYRPGMPAEVAFEEIRTKSGIQFDPECAAAFLRLRPRLEEMLALRYGSVVDMDVPEPALI